MEITDIRIRKIAKNSKLKAAVSITFDDEFAVHDIKVIEGEKGVFVAMPSRKSTDGGYRDIAHPINTLVREKIQKAILQRYESEALFESLDTAEEVAVSSDRDTP
ncbi:MAG: septation regulator SpoVG [Clostridiales bacterium]|nr:septation regulator SpoVG [Clostridiales bacterium]